MKNSKNRDLTFFPISLIVGRFYIKTGNNKLVLLNANLICQMFVRWKDTCKYNSVPNPKVPK